jgi:hypothetical protein
MTRWLALSLLLCASAAHATRVLILWDVRTPQTEALASALKSSGVEVVFSQTDGPGFNGSNPSLQDIDVVVHLNGTTYMREMDPAGQRALLKFVENGGGYVHHEWNAYQYSVGQLQLLRPLILFDRSSGELGPVTLHRVDTGKTHPVIWEVPKSFTMEGAFNVGKVHVFAEEPAVVLAQDDKGNDAIAVREFAFGRIVGFHHAGNYALMTPNTMAAGKEAIRLFVDGVRWAYGCDPSFREGRRDTLCLKIAARRARSVR